MIKLSSKMYSDMFYETECIHDILNFIALLRLFSVSDLSILSRYLVLWLLFVLVNRFDEIAYNRLNRSKNYIKLHV